ncbi:MAG: leucyl/phenylalanyl-tRNA--protein transferase [Gammaproteobacteria bacterium]|nr:leucyl/phenylalanyl-tRNA--protein transferase [Gammaproteobacteria bacterium]
MLRHFPAAAIHQFPDVDTALDEPNGLLCTGGTIDPQTVLNAYCQGIFPWFADDQPPLWWSPDPRCIFEEVDFHVSKKKRQLFRKYQLHTTRNQCAVDVIRACAAATPRREDTWILPEMIQCYGHLAKYGWVQSFEVWQSDELVGGVYGVTLGRLFCGESMFSKRPSASTFALEAVFASGEFDWIDAQIENPHLMSMGATLIDRSQYIDRLQNELIRLRDN